MAGLLNFIRPICIIPLLPRRLGGSTWHGAAETTGIAGCPKSETPRASDILCAKTIRNPWPKSASWLILTLASFSISQSNLVPQDASSSSCSKMSSQSRPRILGLYAPARKDQARFHPTNRCVTRGPWSIGSFPPL